VRIGLADRRDRSTAGIERGDDKIDRAVQLLRRGRDQIWSWELESSDWSALAGGLCRTYSRGVDALEAAVDDPRPDRHHELRKRAKYTWYHLRLINDAAPSVISPLARQFHSLTESLGDAHDLAVLRTQLRDEPDAFGGDDSVGATVAMIDDYRHQLEHRSIALASRLYAESPKRFTKRIGAYWDAWDRLGAEEGGGAIDDIFEVDGDALDDLTVADLRSLATSIDLPGRSTKRRDDLVHELRASGATLHE
jgi:hypothetical protein